MLRVELNRVRRANYPQLTKGRRSWWFGFSVVRADVFSVSCLFSWSPSTRSSRQMMPHTS